VSHPLAHFQAYAEIIALSDAQAKEQPRAINARELIEHLQSITAKPQQDD
jgi:hypothetical protein